MNVLVQVLLEFAQAIIVRMIGGACTNGSGEVVAQAANLGKQRAGGIMFAGHHGDGIGHGAEARIG